MIVGIVSAGHMGSGLGFALREGGARVVTTLGGRSARTTKLAAEAGLEVLPTLGDVVAAAEMILVVTPPGEAGPAATAIAEAALDRSAHPLVADLNAIAPSTVEAVARAYDSAGLAFVDGSLSGPPPTVRPGVRIFLSGPDAARIAELPWQDHARPIVLAGPAGLASAVKMSTASVYKGLDGLVAQAMRSAAHYGVLDAVLEDLRRTGLDRTAGVAMAATKAHRYVPEMREIASAQQAAGVGSALFSAFAEIYAEIATSALAAGDPESIDPALSPDQVVAGITPKPSGRA